MLKKSLYKLTILVTTILLISTYPTSAKISEYQPGKKFILLSIDGGGVRGIIPSMILAEIERKTNTPICQMTDMIAGNSTGAIIALALATPSDTNKSKNKYTANDLVDLYQNQSKKIFHKSLWQNIKTGCNLWGPKYDRTYLDNILKQKFGNTTLSEAVSDVVILSYGLESGEGRVWSSRIARKKKRNDFFMKDIAAASSAAPTYFSPVVISNTQGNFCRKNDYKILKKCTHVDGGVFANNPSIVAAAAVLQANPSMNRSDLIIISLGTGKLEGNHPTNVKNKGIIGWIKNINIIDLILNASEDVSEWATTAFGIKTYRLQPTLDAHESAMDNTSDKNLYNLMIKTQEYIRENYDLIHEVCNILKDNTKSI
ncbi:MAG TPA: patatin-like phospholipase family protein [Candidatus Megaira endosymbiont of Nemacystus decipiens]|nr:patatin-like phospholipase family protein [Candidatus Megaera endosymbiont of Nemacystus decipiens]